MTINQFDKKYPKQVIKLNNNKAFVYRYHKNPNTKATLVLLTGGIGLSDLFYMHFERFAQDFSVITFDYQIQFEDNAEFAGAVAELLDKLEERVWLVGQSLGGIVAQMIAKNYPATIAGMVLSNTCSLPADMSPEAYEHLEEMLKRQIKSKRILSIVPFSLTKKMIAKSVLKKMDGFVEKERQLMKDLSDAMLERLTKEYEFHMLDFLTDVENHRNMTRADFAKWDDKVLLLLSEDDHTFNQACKEELIAIMTNPTVVTDITGGHLALLVRLDRYADAVTNYIKGRVE